MARGNDTMSWAHKMSNSTEHRRLMSKLAFDDYWERLKNEVELSGCLDKPLTKMEDLAIDYQNIRCNVERTGTQSAREGPAKPSLVGSTPTPCSTS